jgi:hypothetical protein
MLKPVLQICLIIKKLKSANLKSRCYPDKSTESSQGVKLCTTFEVMACAGINIADQPTLNKTI